VVSMVASVLFLGAWHTGFWFDDYLLGPLRAHTTQGFDAARYLANVFGLAVITVKGTVLIFVQMWLRWTLPRLRIDQVMTTCLKYLVPISCFLFLGAAVWPLALAYLAGGETTWLPKRPLGDSVPRRVVGGTAEVTVVPHFRTIGVPESDKVSTRQLTLAAHQVDPVATRKVLSAGGAKGARP